MILIPQTIINGIRPLGYGAWVDPREFRTILRFAYVRLIALAPMSEEDKAWAACDD